MLTEDELNEICRRTYELSVAQNGEQTIHTQVVLELVRGYLIPTGLEQAILGVNDSDFMVAEGAKVMLIRAPHDDEGRALDGDDALPLATHPDRVIIIHQGKINQT